MKYIFQVRIKEGHTAEEYAEAWVKASEIIQQAPGARGVARLMNDDCSCTDSQNFALGTPENA